MPCHSDLIFPYIKNSNFVVSFIYVFNLERTASFVSLKDLDVPLLSINSIFIEETL